MTRLPVMPRAERALVLAEAATGRARRRLSLVDVLAGVVAIGCGVGVQALGALGVDLAQLADDLRRLAPGVGGSQALELAEAQARALSHAYVGTEHLLLASMADPLVADVLAAHVGDLRLVRAQVWRTLLDQTPGGVWEPAGPSLPWSHVAEVVDGTIEQESFLPTREARRLGTLVQSLVEEEPQVGAVFGVWIGEQPVFLACHGFADLEAGVRTTRETVFGIGSITKTLTAVAVLQVVEAGLAELDTPVNDLLCDLRVEPGDEMTAPVTLRQLLTHTAGLAPGRGARHYRGSLPTLAATCGPVLRATQPAGAWNYSNLGYAVLGQVIEDATGTSWRHYLTTHVFGPLGMQRSSCQPFGDLGGVIARGYAVERRELFPVRRSEIVLAPAGSVTSTVEDLARFAVAVHEGANSAGRVLASGTTALLAEPVTATGFPGRSQAVGFVIDTVGGRRVLSHAGDGPGMHTALATEPASGATAVAFVNTDTGRLPSLVAQALALASAS